MAKQTLPVNFEDDILDPSMDGKRRYRLIENADGTYSLEDVTDYTQVGSNFGAAQINATNTGVNNSADIADIIDDLDDIAANVTPGKMAGALAVKQLNDNYIVEEGENDNGHYRKWSNGTLEMWGKLILNNVNINNRSNTSTTVYNSTQYRITFPFASLSECIVTCTNYSNTGAWVSMSTGGDRKSSFMFWLYAAGISNGNSHYICWRATGTWK